MESAVGLYKSELMESRPAFTGCAELERETASWVHWCNTSRLRSSIGHLSPIEYEQSYRRAVTSTEVA